MANLRRLSGKLSAGINPAVSCCRLRQVQSLLHQDGAGATSRPDGILCSLGIDSRYNEGCAELAEYLFYGLYGRSQLNVEHLLEEFPEEMLDDVILLIKAECVHLYCNPTNYTHLLPHVSHWRNLHLYCMTDAEYEDEEAAEEFKVSSFVTMVQDCHRIGVPFSSQGHVQRFDVFMVEKWPLIQAFALEGIGRGSFFTMKYKLVDVSEELWQVYNRLDPVSLNATLTQDLVNFEKQWSCFFSSMEQENHLSILELSEAQAGETFRTFFSQGLASNNISDKSEARQPFVLFGSHSSSDELQNYSFNFASESHQVRNTGVRGSTAPHMVVQCVAPKAALCCSRTFFLGSTHTPYLGIHSSRPRKSPVLLLSQIYSAVVQAVLSGIQSFCQSGSTTKAAEVAVQTFLLSLDSVEHSQLRPSLRSKCDFKIQAVDNQGRWIPLCAKESRYAIKTASMTVCDILEMQGGAGEQPLGSVVFSEAFMDSSINIQHGDGSVSTDTCYTILTASVPRYACWPLECDVVLSKEAQHLGQREGPTCLGRPLSTSAAAYLSSAGHLSTQEEGKVTFFSEGLLFVHAQYGAVTVCREHVSAVRFYQPDCDSGVAALLVEYEAALLPHLPLALHGPQRHLLIGLPPGSAPSSSLDTFCSKVVPVWKSSGSGLNLQMLEQDQMSWSLRNLHLRIQKLHDSQAPPLAKRRGSTKACWQMPEQDLFLQHFALSSVSQEPILDQHLGALFPSAEATQPATSFPRDQLVINIISGLAGSHKEKLWSSLLRSRKELRRYVLYAADGYGTFSVSGLHHFVSSLLEEQRSSGVKSRLLLLLLLSPGYCDVLEVVQALLLHPDPAVRSRLTIGAVTACVDPLASCMEHRFAFPKLLEQCSQGVVSNVVWTGSASLSHPLAQHIKQLVRAANPAAAFLWAKESGAISRSEEENLILSESSFNQPQMLRARYLLYPGWCRGFFQCGRGSLLPIQVRLTFSRPLQRTLFVAACRALKSSLSSAPFKGNIYNLWGQVRFSDSQQLVPVNYNTVSGSLELDLDLDLDPGSPELSQPYLVFEGVEVAEESLRAWLTVSAGGPIHPPE